MGGVPNCPAQPTSAARLSVAQSSALSPAPKTNTALRVPKGFGTNVRAKGSSVQFPSTTKRYSYRPGLRCKSTFHWPHPVPKRSIGVAEGCQPLKEPAMLTSFASGKNRSNLTSVDSVCGAASGSGRSFCSLTPQVTLRAPPLVAAPLGAGRNSATTRDFLGFCVDAISKVFIG